MGKKNGRVKDERRGKTDNGNADAAMAADDEHGGATPRGELSNKDYNRELKKLHVELVKLQQWVLHEGLDRKSVV